MKNIGLGIALVLSTSVVHASCSSLEEIKAAQTKWASTLATISPTAMSALYAHDAILLATYASHPITTSKGRTHYFETLYKNLPHTTVHYDEVVTRLLPGGNAVSSGIYTFSGVKNGKAVNIPARFTFVYEDSPQGCLLIDHHSSQMPES